MRREARDAGKAKGLAIGVIVVIGMIASVGGSFGQVTTAGVPVVAIAEGYYVAAVFAGIILAFAFQLILTQFSIAAGVTSMGDLRESKRETEGWDLRRLPAKLGVWALLTASLSLFGATWLAVELSGAVTLLTAGVLGLVIWGLFYIAMIVFETTALSSLVGCLVATATAGLRAVSSIGGSVFSRSEGRRIADTSALVAAAVRDEILGTAEVRKARRALWNYFKQSQLPSLEASTIKKEILDMLENVEIRATVEEEEESEARGRNVVATVGIKERGGVEPYEMLQRADKAIRGVREEYYSEKDRPSKVIDGVARLMGKTESEARELREGVEEFLRKTGREELQPERIKEELDQLITNPKEGYEELKRHFAGMSPETLSALISSSTELTEEEARAMMGEANAMVEAVMQAAREALKRGKAEWESVSGTLTERIRTYLDGLGRPELSYDEISRDIEEIIADPKASVEVLRQRLQALDRESLTAVLASRKDISEEDARRIIERIEGVREEIARKAEQINTEIERRVEEARVKAVELAEEGRKQIATAAWWAFATAAISAVAAMLGGFAAIQTL